MNIPTCNRPRSSLSVRAPPPPPPAGSDSGRRACGRRPKHRFKWTEYLKERFNAAVNILGGLERATPTALLDLLNDIPELKYKHVRSHLQVVRYAKHNEEASEAELEASSDAEQDTGSTSVLLAVETHDFLHHQFYQVAPLPSPPQTPSLPACRCAMKVCVDPVGPMPPNIPPSMRVMNISNSEPRTIVFKDLFRACNRKMMLNDGNVVPTGTNGAKKLLGGSSGASSSATMKETNDVSIELNLG